MYVATRGLYRMKPPTVVVPTCIKETVEQLFEVHRRLDGSELKHHLIALDVGNVLCPQLYVLVSPGYIHLLVILTRVDNIACNSRTRVLCEKGP